MSEKRLKFSNKQWAFLAVFEAMGGPVSLDIVGAVSPLLPSQLLDVVRRAEECAIIEKTEGGTYCLVKGLSSKTQNVFLQINTKERISLLLDRMNQEDLIDQLSLDTYSNLLIRSGREQGGQFEINLAQKFLSTHELEKALLFFKKGLNGLFASLERPNAINQFIECALTFSDLTFSLGREFISAYQFLESAAPLAEGNGDVRAKALIDLHIGRLFYFGNRRHEAVALIKKTEEVINELGDDDIKIRAAEFLALYYYMQGRFSEAMEFFETGFRSFESLAESHIANPSAPIFYGYCAAYLGQFHKAIGNLDSAWRRARQTKNSAYAATLRASLGMILLLTKKEKEAALHIEKALNEARDQGNIFGWYFAQGYMAYLHYLDGRYETAARMLKQVSEEGKQSNIVYQVSSPWLLEMIFDLKIQGHSVFTDQEIHENIIRMLSDPSTHIRGVVLRLLVQVMETTNVPDDQVDVYFELVKKSANFKDVFKGNIKKVIKIFLKQSESYLKPTGDPVQLAKTRIALAQLALKSGERKEAVVLAGKARKGLSGFWEDYFPDGIRGLLDESFSREIQEASPGNFVLGVEQLFQATAELAPSLDMDDFFHRMVTIINRLFRAEKGGLFWADDQNVKSLLLRAARNLNISDVTQPEFSHNITAVRQCFKSGKSKIIRSKQSSRKLKRYNAFSLVCIPLKLNGKTSGVLYYDNSYINDCFDFLDEPVLDRLSGHLNVYIERVYKIEALIAEAKTPSQEVIVSGSLPHNKQILANSQEMATILENADQIALSDSTVLIQGESGVGKELMAERIHYQGPLRNKPFIIIDPTTIPENLFESELFGYEKGSFTGADRQKRGRIELAHLGTLFIDEIGEMPKAIQAKLLRVIQEKTFTRIGGSRFIHSDFRLLAATNRNLSEEVAKGNFREDLFYRISIVPIHIPPLRERKEDILLLAQHFLDRYNKKYHHIELSFSSEDEVALMEYHWPGNIRELINVIERAVILSKDGKLKLSLKAESGRGALNPFTDSPTMEELQSRYIKHILEKTNGRISGAGGAAEILNMKRSTLYSRMDRLGISK